LRQEFGEGEFSPVHSTEIMFAQKDFLNWFRILTTDILKKTNICEHVSVAYQFPS
jgi:hypothetical protein